MKGLTRDKNCGFFVEEESAEQMLSVIMPRLLEATGKADNVAYQILPFQGKSDLEKNCSEDFGVGANLKAVL